MRRIIGWEADSKNMPENLPELLVVFPKLLVPTTNIVLSTKKDGKPTETWKIVDVMNAGRALQIVVHIEAKVTFALINNAWYVDGIDEKYATILLYPNAADEEGLKIWF